MDTMGTSRRWLTMLLLGGAAAAEGWLGHQLLQRPGDFLQLLPVHAATAAATAICAVLLYRRGERSPLFLLFVVSLIFLGPVCIPGIAVAALLRRGFAWRASPFAEWYDALFPPQETNPTRALYERIVLRGGGPGERSTVAPFVDVMALGSVREKQSVIALMAENFQPAFAEALRTALNDQEAAVRVQAAATVAHIENRFLQRAMALEQQSARSPDDPHLLLSLARLYDEQASTGLLDEGRARETAMRALSLYSRAIELRRGPADPAATEAIGRLLLQLDHPQEALDVLTSVIGQPAVSPSTIGRYLECLFRLRRFDALRAACRHFCRPTGLVALPDEVLDAARLWVEGAGTAIKAVDA